MTLVDIGLAVVVTVLLPVIGGDRRAVRAASYNATGPQRLVIKLVAWAARNGR